jgi:predicted ester cyclase
MCPRTKEMEGADMEQTTDIARRFVEAFIGGDAAVIDEVVADDVVDHHPLPGQPAGRAGIHHASAVYRTGFPDLTTTVDLQLADRDLVFQQGAATGTNTGSLMGLPPTGRPATIAWMDLYRVANGRIVEIWHLEDIAGALQQLGHLFAAQPVTA